MRLTSMADAFRNQLNNLKMKEIPCKRQTDLPFTTNL